MSRPRLETSRLLLEGAEPAHAAAFTEYLRRNEQHFAPFAPPGSPAQLEAGFWATEFAEEDRRGVRFLIHERGASASGQPGKIIGDCRFSGIMRGPFQAC